MQGTSSELAKQLVRQTLFHQTRTFSFVRHAIETSLFGYFFLISK
jgi:hypothetical protein